jgi:hypothetical protein
VISAVCAVAQADGLPEPEPAIRPSVLAVMERAEHESPDQGTA